jgi:hypothetical protein
MATLSIPASASLPPAFTVRERAKVDAFFGRGRRARRPANHLPRLTLPLLAAVWVVTLVTAVAV